MRGRPDVPGSTPFSNFLEECTGIRSRRLGAVPWISPFQPCEGKGNLPDAGSLSAAFDLPGMRRREAGGAFCGLHRFVRLTDAGGIEPPLPVLETGVLPSYEASSTFKTKPPSGSVVLEGNSGCGTDLDGGMGKGGLEPPCVPSEDGPVPDHLHDRLCHYPTCSFYPLWGTEERPFAPCQPGDAASHFKA